MTDPYDLGIEVSEKYGIRIAPLFYVFAAPPSSPFNWDVCATTLQGDPDGEPHSVHMSLEDALAEARKQNRIATGQKQASVKQPKPAALSFAEMLKGNLLKKVDKTLAKNGKKGA